MRGHVLWVIACLVLGLMDIYLCFNGSAFENHFEPGHVRCLQEGMLFDLIGIQFYNNNPCDGTPAKVDASYHNDWAPL